LRALASVSKAVVELATRDMRIRTTACTKRRSLSRPSVM
jgi:hypothetical protein